MSTKDELAGLRRFLAAHEDGIFSYGPSDRNCKHHREIGILKREIAYLEGVLARA